MACAASSCPMASSKKSGPGIRGAPTASSATGCSTTCSVILIITPWRPGSTRCCSITAGRSRRNCREATARCSTWRFARSAGSRRWTRSSMSGGRGSIPRSTTGALTTVRYLKRDRTRSMPSSRSSAPLRASPGRSSETRSFSTAFGTGSSPTLIFPAASGRTGSSRRPRGAASRASTGRASSALRR